MEEEVGEEQFHNEDKEDKRILLARKKKIVTILKNKQISERSQENISIKSEK